MEQNFSVIIPTLWEPDFFLDTLSSLNSNKLIDEIIVISNDPNKKPLGALPSKVRVLDMEVNIGVNPAWNLGVKESKNENLIILNDDIIIGEDFFKDVTTLSDDFQLIGIDYESVLKSFKEVDTRTNGFGCCFYIHKDYYVPIPNNLKIFFGDDWLFLNCLHKKGRAGVISGILNNGILSLSSNRYKSNVLIEFQTYMKEISKVYNHTYKFSIIIPYHHTVANSSDINKLLESIDEQTFKDFEVLLIHDGPNPEASDLKTSVTYTYKLEYIETKYRYDDWGHSLRDMGIKSSNGEYLLFLNCDNIFYSDGLAVINDCIEKEDPYGYTYGDYKWNSKDIVIFPIKLIGQTTDGFHLFRSEDDLETEMILTGYPPQVNYIDCMQLVMSKAKWDYYGGWYNKSFAADGEMYPRFVQENLGARYAHKVLGEHR